jgi:hypothetical protein
MHEHHHDEMLDQGLWGRVFWVFGTATVITNKGKGMFADRLRTSPGTYTTSPKFCAMGVGATGAARTAVAADTALSTEVESRTSGTESTVTTTQTGDTYQVTGTITATSNRVVDEAGLFDAASTGNMFLSATFPVINLLSANPDSIAFTFKGQAA